MKNPFLYFALFSAISSFSLQGMMLWESPESIHKDLSAMQLQPIEKSLVERIIKKRGVDSVRKEINNPSRQKLLTVLEIKETFHRDEANADPLVKTIFDTIDAAESRPKKATDMPIAHNYFGFRSWYNIHPHNSDTIFVTMKSCNIQELNAICDNYKE